jgi:diaminopimelate decarboxylase
MMKLPVHGDIEGFGFEGNCLLIGGQRVTDIARAHGTPLYVYDSGLVRQRVAELRRALPAAIKLHYAIKANPMPELVRLIASLVDGLDVASAGELDIALQCQVNPLDISFAGPGKRSAELEQAVCAGIVVNIESELELARIDKVSKRVGKPANVAIRVNPDFELKSSGMRMSGGPKPFGIDAERVPAVLVDLARRAIPLHGLHIFSGSQNLRADAICEAQTKSVELAFSLIGSGPAPRLLNIGGGFGIPYFPGDRRLPLAPIASNLTTLLSRIADRWPRTEVVLELGRYIVGEAGVYVCEVIDKKVSRGHVFLVTDGGMHHHLAASGNFGQVLRKNYPVLIGNRLFCEPETVTVVGPLCTPLDILAERMALPSASVGDLVVVFQSGAYGRSASPLGFLGHPPPGELLV